MASEANLSADPPSRYVLLNDWAKTLAITMHTHAYTYLHSKALSIFTDCHSEKTQKHAETSSSGKTSFPVLLHFLSQPTSGDRVNPLHDVSAWVAASGGPTSPGSPPGPRVVFIHLGRLSGLREGRITVLSLEPTMATTWRHGPSRDHAPRRTGGVHSTCHVLNGVCLRFFPQGHGHFAASLDP